MKTVLFTLSLDGLANMPCNPSIGGTAKGHLVREIDALGGEMGKAADATFLQSRMLNLGKGPAVHSLRVQSDRRAYHHYMKRVIENQPNLSLKQGEIVDIQVEDGRLTGVVTKLGMVYKVQAAIICSRHLPKRPNPYRRNQLCFRSGQSASQLWSHRPSAVVRHYHSPVQNRHPQPGSSEKH